MGFPNIWNLIPRPNLTHLAPYICVYIYVCVCMCVCVCVRKHVRGRIYIYTHTNTCMGAHTHVCIHVCVYIQLIVSHLVRVGIRLNIFNNSKQPSSTIYIDWTPKLFESSFSWKLDDPRRGHLFQNWLHFKTAKQINSRILAFTCEWELNFILS